MRKKFVQVALLPLCTVLLLAGFLPTPAGASSGLGGQVIRIGIYYGDAGKNSVNLKLTQGDGFEFGTYDGGGNFVPLPDVSAAALKGVTVQVDNSTSFGFVVLDSATGLELFRYDDKGLGTGLAVRPYSLSGEKTVTKCGYAYYGGFRFERFTSYNDLMTIVNYLPLDDYIQGVVPYEMSASWPIEALKAQAVCARTYALTRGAVHQKYHFDLCDSTHCQAYKGVYAGSYADRVNEAVTGTGGVTVQYGGKYCQTVYSSSNGGASESNINVSGTDYPYLTGKLDPFEAQVEDIIPDYHWSKSFTGKELQAELAGEGYTDCGPVIDVKTTLSPTGNVIALTFQDPNGKSYTIHRGKCRTFLSLRSLRYSVSGGAGEQPPGGSVLTDTSGHTLDLSQGIAAISGDGSISTVTEGYVITSDGERKIGTVGNSGAAGETLFTFTGTGWGHNVGMSQWGAYAMAELGYTYKDILEFYYTGVTVG